MRIALIADIHGNRVALEAVLGDIRRAGADAIVCLGDVAAHGPEPGESLDLVQSLGCPVVMGNTDAALLEEPEMPEGDADWVRIGHLYKWCAGRLDDAQAAFVRSFVPGVTLGDLYACHGSPKSYDDKILATTPEEQLAAWLEGVGPATVACGHTHLALLRRHGGKTIVNPGSVGQPLVVDPRTGSQRLAGEAEYAILTAGVGAEFRRVAFDVEAVREAARRARLPHLEWWLKWWEI